VANTSITFTQPPPRNDLVLEDLFPTNGSGSYTSPWLDSGGVLCVRIAIDAINGVSVPNAAVVEAQWDDALGVASAPRIIRSQSLPAGSGTTVYGEIDLTCRYYQLSVSNAPANDFVAITVRRVDL